MQTLHPQTRKRKNATPIDDLLFSSISLPTATATDENGAKRQQRPKRGKYRLDRIRTNFS